MARPGERFADVDAEKLAPKLSSSIKLSKPQKRRARLQKLAVHKAIEAGCHQRGSSDMQQDVWKELDTRLSTIEGVLMNLHWNLIGQFYEIAPDIHSSEAMCSNLLSHLSPTLVDSSVSSALFFPVDVSKAAMRIQRWFRTCRLPMKADLAQSGVGIDAPQSDAGSCGDYCNISCTLCREVFSADSDSADACDICLKPHHSHCLKSVRHPVESYSVCTDCVEEAEFRSCTAPQDSSIALSPQVAAIQAACGGGPSRVSVQEDNVPVGWPDLDEAQQHAFKKWFTARLQKKRKILETALEHEVSRAESEQMHQHNPDSHVRVARARELQSQLKALDETENMRREAWQFCAKDECEG